MPSHRGAFEMLIIFLAILAVGACCVPFIHEQGKRDGSCK